VMELTDGTITFAAVLRSDGRAVTAAVTGGTGAYANARGQMELKSRAGGTEFAFIFHLIG